MFKTFRKAALATTLATGLAAALLAGGAAVLAEFAFADKPRDGNAETHNGLEHVVDVIGGGVADRPRLGSIGFMFAAQPADQSQ